MLAEKTREFLSSPSSVGSTKGDSERRQTTKIIESWKKALSGKAKNSDNYQNNKVVKSKSSLMPFSSPSQPPLPSQPSIQPITNGNYQKFSLDCCIISSSPAIFQSGFLLIL